MADFARALDSYAVATAKWVDAPLGVFAANFWRTTALAKWINATPGSFDAGAFNASPAIALWLNVDFEASDGLVSNDWAPGASVDPLFLPWTFKMRGMDALLDGVYDTWLSLTPDLAAADYAGALNLPLRDVVVIDVWGDGHHQTHELGGDDELNVGGLSGLLADAQRANVLVTAGGDLAAATVNDGQLVGRSGSAYMGYPPVSTQTSEIPSSLHPDNDEFDGAADTFPTGWGIWRGATNNANLFAESSLVLASGTPVVGVDPYTAVPVSSGDASKTKYNVNSRRASWMFVQTPQELGADKWRFLWAKKLSSDLPADFTVMARFSMLDLVGPAQHGAFGFVLFEDLAGAPNPARNLRMILNPEASTFRANVAVRSTATARDYAGTQNNLHGLHQNLMIVRATATSLIHFYVGTAVGSWSLVNQINVIDGNYRWWGIVTMNRSLEGSDLITQPYVGCDWIRRWDSQFPL